MRKRRTGERRNARCVVHIAETDEQKCSRPCTAATVHIATGDASTAGPASVPKRGQCVGVVFIGSGRARAMQADVWRHVDHIVPARLIRRLNAGNPDRRENLQCICGTCHGYKLQADHKLCMGDKLGYLEILRTHHFDLGRVERALAHYGL